MQCFKYRKLGLALQKTRPSIPHLGHQMSIPDVNSGTDQPASGNSHLSKLNEALNNGVALHNESHKFKFIATSKVIILRKILSSSGN